MLPGNGKISYVASRILIENCSTLASDKRHHFYAVTERFNYFKRIQIEPEKVLNSFLVRTPF